MTPHKPEAERLAERCRAFIEDQACGEWYEETIAADAQKLLTFVEQEIASTRAEAYERAAQIEGGLTLLLAAVHAGDPKREMLVRIGDLMRDAAAIRKLEQGGEVVKLSEKQRAILEGLKPGSNHYIAASEMTELEALTSAELVHPWMTMGGFPAWRITPAGRAALEDEK